MLLLSELPKVSFGQWMAVGMTLLIVCPLGYAVLAALVGKTDSARNAGRFGLVAMMCTGLLLLVNFLLTDGNTYHVGMVLALIGGVPLLFMKSDKAAKEARKARNR